MGEPLEDDGKVELAAERVGGTKQGRNSAAEIVVFDSTGTGLQDVAAAIAVYRRALDADAGTKFKFS